MVDTPRQPLRERNRQAARDLVLDAAERLLQTGETADFSMRALAAEAGVGFATPFNHFGNKNAIMQALSARVIARMAERFRDEAPTGDAADRVLAMGRVSVALLLQQPDVYKVVVGSLGVAASTPSSVRLQSRALWSMALGDFDGLLEDHRERARAALPEQLAFTFRGCLSFWIAGELGDSALSAAFETGAAMLLLGFVKADRCQSLLQRISDNGMARRQEPPRPAPAPAS